MGGGGLIGYVPVVVVRRMTSTLSNDISYEATGPFKPKFHLWPPWAGGSKVCVFMKFVFLVWLLWQLRISIGL